jgi:hypothetical protein
LEMALLEIAKTGRQTSLGFEDAGSEGAHGGWSERVEEGTRSLETRTCDPGSESRKLKDSKLLREVASGGVHATVPRRAGDNFVTRLSPGLRKAGVV